MFDVMIKRFVEDINALRCGIQEALEYAAALVSLKMETPGPFSGTEEDVYTYMKEYYSLA